MNAVLQTYRYARPSFVSDDGRPRLALATAVPADGPPPRFFEGRMLEPRLVAEMLAANLSKPTPQRLSAPTSTC